MTFEERVEAADRRRADGNSLYASGQFGEAISKYRCGHGKKTVGLGSGRVGARGRGVGQERAGDGPLAGGLRRTCRACRELTERLRPAAQPTAGAPPVLAARLALSFLNEDLMIQLGELGQDMDWQGCCLACQPTGPTPLAAALRMRSAHRVCHRACMPPPPVRRAGDFHYAKAMDVKRPALLNIAACQLRQVGTGPGLGVVVACAGSGWRRRARGNGGCATHGSALPGPPKAVLSFPNTANPVSGPFPSCAQEDYHAAIATCSDVLKEEKRNAKALYRRGA